MFTVFDTEILHVFPTSRRQRNRIAITLLTISLPLELRCSSIRLLNEEIRRLGCRENRESLNEHQQTQLGIYREI